MSSASATEASAPVLLVLAGPAGSGKTTLCERMVAEVAGFSRVVTTTTREPRPGEVNGVDYHFFSAEEFDQRLAENAFLEWAWVHRKNRYGTLASSVLDPLAAGRSLIINVDVQGVENFRRAAAANPLLARHMGTVYIDVPIEELQERLVGRGESETEIERRMITARQEQQERAKFDYVITSSTKAADFDALLEIWREQQERVSAVG
ncbi:guanylate kinase [Synoicihabitans lomoniglobus]|uniref:Guanylate kinase n=1 Tax=Synoicihabitans lomoniglobus TaxID=2909285 RepID=A0AAF0CMS6_9BACT|nr:AAA family ATPase [Opitutaceae bacterium LMO-M01]WED64578.1 AAA family ATPase [Opitutaceae bacterium LMO-M01]